MSASTGSSSSSRTGWRARPGGQLLAGRRVLANTAPATGAKPVETTISPGMERAAVAALGGQYGGMVVMNPRTGAVLAAAGIA